MKVSTVYMIGCWAFILSHYITEFLPNRNSDVAVISAGGILFVMYFAEKVRSNTEK